MSLLLWTLTIIGTWNAINQVARIYYREPIAYHYGWSIIVGVWAGVLLWQQS